MLTLISKAFIGAGLVVFIAVAAKSKNYYLAGLAPLFPTFAMIAHYTVAHERSLDELRATIVFGMWSLLPYLAYLIAMYFLVEYFSLSISLFLSAAIWLIIAFILIIFW